MRRVTDELRAAHQSLAEAEGDQPGHDYDRGYLTGWHDERRHVRRIRPDGGFRDRGRVAEFRLGYRHGREGGAGQPADWWPDHALGRVDEDGHAIPGSGAAGLRDAIARAASRASLAEKPGRADEDAPAGAA
jgi:hypothetical protein